MIVSGTAVAPAATVAVIALSLPVIVRGVVPSTLPDASTPATIAGRATIVAGVEVIGYSPAMVVPAVAVIHAGPSIVRPKVAPGVAFSAGVTLINNWIG